MRFIVSTLKNKKIIYTSDITRMGIKGSNRCYRRAGVTDSLRQYHVGTTITRIQATPSHSSPVTIYGRLCHLDARDVQIMTRECERLFYDYEIQNYTATQLTRATIASDRRNLRASCAEICLLPSTYHRYVSCATQIRIIVR